MRIGWEECDPESGAIEQVLGETEVRTPDLNGSATTSEVSDGILGALEKFRSEDARP